MSWPASTSLYHTQTETLVSTVCRDVIMSPPCPPPQRSCTETQEQRGLQGPGQLGIAVRRPLPGRLKLISLDKKDKNIPEAPPGARVAP